MHFQIEYSKSSSSKNQYGGGVLNDLSHEIDYILWLFGNFKIGYSYLSKISNLKINQHKGNLCWARFSDSYEKRGFRLGFNNQRY